MVLPWYMLLSMKNEHTSGWSIQCNFGADRISRPLPQLRKCSVTIGFHGNLITEPLRSSGWIPDCNEMLKICPAWITFRTLTIMEFFWLLSFIPFSAESVFCRILYSTNLLVNSLPEVGSGRTVWRTHPSTVELSRSLLILCFGDSLSWISAFNQLKLHCAYQNSSTQSSTVDCVT
jgi:hypothetical protein